MNIHEARNPFSLKYVTAVLALVVFGSTASAQKKTSAPAKAAPAKAAPAKGGPSTAAKTGGATASHGPTTSGASHGITTSSRGATTSGGTRGANTAANRVGGGATGSRGAAGAKTTTMAGGHVVPANSHITRTANGSEVRTRPNGKVADVHDARRGMDIHNGLNGSRRVSVERADHSRIVAERGGRGYVEHPYRYGGREFGHRTYYDHGRAYDRYYNHYYYRGGYMDVYAPGYYYRPAFYGWAYNPWVSPVAYAWGWGGNPWYGYYGYYFTPYPVYASASLWLTDYMISNTLAAAYQAQVDANIAAQQAAADAAPLNPQVKDLIAAEVQRQIALENAEAQTAQNAPADPASSGIQRMLTDGVQHVFIAGSDIDVVDASGTECAISQGDALQLTGPPPPDATAASLVMLSSKGGQECRRGITVSVAVSDLQDMQNHMRETIDQGMGELKVKGGTGGLPAVPSAADGAPVKASFTAGAPGPDPNAASEIKQESQAADQAEQQDVSQAQASGPAAPTADAPSPIPAPAAPPVQISLGQSIDDVTGSLGTPSRIVDLGAKKIYVYKDMKVTFKDGKVSDVQ